MTIAPTPFTVGVRAYVEGAEDPRGNPEDTWADAVAQPVYGWAPAGTSEPFDPGRDAVTWDLDLLVPPEFTVGRKDRIVVAGEEFEVEGGLQDYNHGPFGFRPGAVVRLRRTEG